MFCNSNTQETLIAEAENFQVFFDFEISYRADNTFGNLKDKMLLWNLLLNIENVARIQIIIIIFVKSDVYASILLNQAYADRLHRLAFRS